MYVAQTAIQIGLCFHSPYTLNDERLKVLLSQLGVEDGQMELILVDNYSARPHQREQTDLFIDLKLVQDDMENIPVKFAKVDADRFALCMTSVFGLSSPDSLLVDQQLSSLLQQDGAFHFQVEQYSFCQLEQQAFPCIYV